MTTRTLSLVAIVGAAVLLLAGCSRSANTAERLNGDANHKYAAGDFGGALETYRRAEVLRPDLPSLNYNAGNTLNRQSDFERAIAENQRALHSTDAQVQDRAYYSMGNAYVRTNQLREAVDAYKSALRANPADADAKYNLEIIQQRLAQAQARQQQDGSQQGQPAPSQNSQAGQSEQSQEQSGQGGQGNNSQNAEAGGEAGQPQAGQPGQGSAAASSSGSAGGYTGTPAGQADALDPNLKRALDQYNQSGSVDDALRALDIMAQQERLRQAGSGTPPSTQGKDW